MSSVFWMKVYSLQTGEGTLIGGWYTLIVLFMYSRKENEGTLVDIEGLSPSSFL